VKKTLVVLLLRGLQGLTIFGAVFVIGGIVHAVHPFSGRSDCGGIIAEGQCDLKTLSGALGMYETDNGTYPTTEQGLRALLVRPAGQELPRWRGPYIDQADLPRDPWGHGYVYLVPRVKHRSGYDLISAGPDGQLGTADDIENP